MHHLTFMQMKICFILFKYFLQALKFINPKCERGNETCLISFLNLLSTHAPVSLPPEEETMVVVGVCCCCCHSLHVCLPTNISVAQEISLCLLQSVNNCSSELFQRRTSKKDPHLLQPFCSSSIRFRRNYKICIPPFISVM